MKLYHFTSRYHIQGCLKEGLTLGAVVINIKKKLYVSGYQWLTINKDFNQFWSKHSTLPYDRTDFRLTLKIPRKIRKQRLHKWNDYALNIVSQEMKDTLNVFGDPENWYIFQGTIHPKFIRTVAVKDPTIELAMKNALSKLH